MFASGSLSLLASLFSVLQWWLRSCQPCWFQSGDLLPVVAQSSWRHFLCCLCPGRRFSVWCKGSARRWHTTNYGFLRKDLLRANLFLDETIMMTPPIWIVNLGLSKALDKVFGQHCGVCCANKTFRIINFGYWFLCMLIKLDKSWAKWTTARKFRQVFVRVLNPRLVCAVLEDAMRHWTQTVGVFGLDLQDGLPPLLDS